MRSHAIAALPHASAMDQQVAEVKAQKLIDSDALDWESVLATQLSGALQPVWQIPFISLAQKCSRK